ncbi:MAG: hypothetical protein HGN29_15270 [Asgard group archaeon]|nr:hypothetical protein [Asgard group archaeon]
MQTRSNINLTGPFFTLKNLVTPGDAFNSGFLIIDYLNDINIDAKLEVINYDCNNPDPS